MGDQVRGRAGRGLAGFWLVCWLAAAAAAAQQRPATEPTDRALNQGEKAEAIAPLGMVSTQLESSTLAALQVLEDGGNAVDAALTALFVQQVHDYHMVFLFGSMSALYYDAASRTVHALVAVGQRPDQGRVSKGDPAKVAVGGTVRGAEALARRFGSRPWASYLEPAIAAAEEGAIVTSFMYGLNFALFEVGLLGDLRDNEEARAFYMPEGFLVGVGNRWRMPALAQTLRRLADEGADYMYTGAWAKKFVAQAQRRGHGVELHDLAGYQPEWREATRFSYRGHELYGSPPPDTGGLEVGFMLNVLESFDLPALGHWQRSPETLALLVRAFDRTRRETDGIIRDPLTWELPGELWLDADYGRQVARFVRHTAARVDLTPPEDAPGAGGGGDSGRVAARGNLGSDHLVVADRYGNWLSLLHTIHGGAPGVFVDGVRATGSELGGETRGPGRRLALPITAVMALRDGKPWLAMGTPGYPPQPVTEVLLNVLAYGMDPRAAADAPRFWSDGQAKVRVESRIGQAVRDGLAARGIAIEELGDYNYHTGSMQIVWRDAEGRLHGVTDARRLGFAAGH